MNKKMEFCSPVRSLNDTAKRIQLKKRLMENEKKLEVKFITGEFSQEDARELLLNIISKKIQFHSVDSHRLWEKNANEDSSAKKRFEELQFSRAQVLQLLTSQSTQGKKIKINSIIEIEVLD
jgi:hypothetical protein